MEIFSSLSLVHFVNYSVIIISYNYSSISIVARFVANPSVFDNVITRLRPFLRTRYLYMGEGFVKIKRNILRLFSALPNFVQTFTCNLKQIATSNISKRRVSNAG